MTCTPGAAEVNSATVESSAVAPDHLVGDRVDVDPVRQLGVPAGHPRRGVGDQQHPDVGVRGDDGGDVPALGDDPPRRVGDQLASAG